MICVPSLRGRVQKDLHAAFGGLYAVEQFGFSFVAFSLLLLVLASQPVVVYLVAGLIQTQNHRLLSGV